MKDYAGFLFDPENPKNMKITFNTVDGINLENFCNMEDHVYGHIHLVLKIGLLVEELMLEKIVALNHH